MEHVLAAARYAGISLGTSQLDRIERYSVWLRSEAQLSGGIGPGESTRLERRHLADSLLFASQLAGSREVWDLGTGVGLPGIPLAIAMPDTEFVLVDRSRRRADLTRRVIRILELANCQLVQDEISDLEVPMETIVSRATLPPDDMLQIARRLLVSGGQAVVGGSWLERPEHPGWKTIEIPRGVLDQTVWLLMMRRE